MSDVLKAIIVEFITVAAVVAGMVLFPGVRPKPKPRSRRTKSPK